MSEDVQEQFEKRFSELQQQLKFTATLEDLDKVFFFKDMAENEGVMPRLDRQLCRRIVDTFFSWNGFFHRLIMPNPHSMFESTEAGFFTEADHKEMVAAMSKTLAHCSQNNLIGAQGNKAAQGSFIDESLALWNELQPLYEKITAHVNSSWKERAASPQ